MQNLSLMFNVEVRGWWTELTFEIGSGGDARRCVLRRIFRSGDVEDGGVWKGS